MASLPDPVPAAGLAEVTRAPVPLIPNGYRLNDKGLFWEDNDTWRLIAGPFAVLALTRDRHNEAWGVLLEWRTTMDARTAWPWPAPHWPAMAASAPGPAGPGFACQCQHPRTQCPASLSDTSNNNRPRPRRFEGGLADGCFALPDRTIAPDGADLVVYQGQGLAEHDYRAGGTLEGWQSEVAAPPLATAALPLPCARAWSGHCWHGRGRRRRASSARAIVHRQIHRAWKRRPASGGQRRSCGNGAPRPTGWKARPNWPTKPCWCWTSWPSLPR
jgi:putative DNA primase/helicase